MENKLILQNYWVLYQLNLMFSPCDLKSRHTKHRRDWAESSCRQCSSLPKSAALLHWLECLVPASSPKRNSKADHHMVCRMAKALPHMMREQEAWRPLCSALKRVMLAQHMRYLCPPLWRQRGHLSRNTLGILRNLPSPGHSAPSRALETRKLHDADILTYSIGLFNWGSHLAIPQHWASKVI